jgi:hypothetical protein
MVILLACVFCIDETQKKWKSNLPPFFNRILLSSAFLGGVISMPQVINYGWLGCEKHRT